MLSDRGGGLGLLRVGGGRGRGLSWECVHGAQELVGDASCLAEPAEQSAVDGGRVVSDRVFAAEEEPGDGLAGGRGRQKNTRSHFYA